MIAARIGIKYGNPDESNQSFHFITAKDIPAMVILTVAFNPIFFAVCIPTINCSPPSTKKNDQFHRCSRLDRIYI
jgi:hypothetical protein